MEPIRKTETSSNPRACLQFTGKLSFKPIFWGSLVVIASSIFVISMPSVDPASFYSELISLLVATLSMSYVCLLRFSGTSKIRYYAMRTRICPALTLCLPWLGVSGLNLTLLAKNGLCILQQPARASGVNWRIRGACVAQLITTSMGVIMLIISCVFFATYELSDTNIDTNIFCCLTRDKRESTASFSRHEKKLSASSATIRMSFFRPSMYRSSSFMSTCSSLETGLYCAGLPSTPPTPSDYTLQSQHPTQATGLGIYNHSSPPSLRSLSRSPSLETIQNQTYPHPPPFTFSKSAIPNSAWTAIHPPLQSFRHAHTCPSVRLVAPSPTVRTLSLHGQNSYASLRSKSLASATPQVHPALRRPSVARSSSSGSGSIKGSPLRTVTSVEDFGSEGRVGGRGAGFSDGVSEDDSVPEVPEVPIEYRLPKIQDLVEGRSAYVVEVLEKYGGVRSNDEEGVLSQTASEVPKIPEMRSIAAIAWPKKWVCTLHDDGRASLEVPSESRVQELPIELECSRRDKAPDRSPEIEPIPLVVPKKRVKGPGSAMDPQEPGNGKKMGMGRSGSWKTLRRFALERSRRDGAKDGSLGEE